MRGVLSSIRGSQEVHIQNLFMVMQGRTRELQQGLAPPCGVRYLRSRVPAEDEVIPVLLQEVWAARQPRLTVDHLRLM